ncbi:MAG: hypothetical protein ACE5ER_02585 [Nitrospinaceae bacterium]
MIEVECYSGYRVNERPLAFRLQGRSYQVKEIIDSWYGETSVYFKVQADDDNIYLLKYDNVQDKWDLIFYQDSRKMDTLMSPGGSAKPLGHPLHEPPRNQKARSVH